ncbi:MAG: TonB-dependent receptor plug domain-containing protein, partial [Ginsengibacter sp.]
MRYIYLFIVSILFILPDSFAQIDREPLPSGDADVLQINSGNRVYGKVIDIQKNKSVEDASVQLFAKINSIDNNGAKDSLIAAMLTKPNGEFNFEKVSPFKNLKLVISAVGYGEYKKDFTFAPQAVDSEAAAMKDLGNVVLSREHERLEGITIVADRPALRMGIDKKIFEVDKSLTSKGGTAVDLMKNIPSVSVDVDGNVELRNSSPTIFVDGRPTILTLDQIPSDNIDRIELITNPSAKYDASSSGGIINIILKKNKRNGFNGLVSVSGGTPGIFSSNANLNLRQGKLNFFLSGNYNNSENESNGKSFRQNKVDGVTENYFD